MVEVPPSSGGEETPTAMCKSWTVRRPHAGTQAPSAPRLQGRREGVRPPAPLLLLFSSASSSPQFPWRGGGVCQPTGRGTRSSSPAPRSSPPPLSPETGGRGLQGRGGPRPHRRDAASLGGRPCCPRADPDPGGDHPAPQRAAGGAGRGGGPAYRDVRNALLALVRHGPSGARGPAAGLAGCLSLVRMLSWSRSPRER